MKKNVFLRSTLRQPVKTVMLLLVTALISFVFVSRVSEYLLIRQETERLSGQYRSVGTVQYKSKSDLTKNEEAVRRLEDDPYIKTVEQIRHGSAVAEEVYNTSADDPYAFAGQTDVFFYGTLLDVRSGQIPLPGSADGEVQIIYQFYFTVDEVVAGYPQAIRAGDLVTLVSSYQHTVYFDYFTGLRPQYVDLTSLMEEMETGKRYLLRGEHSDWSTYNRSRGSEDGDADGNGRSAALTFKPLTVLSPIGYGDAINLDGGLWYIPVEPGESVDFNDPSLAGVLQAIQMVDSNQHCLHTIGSQDVSTLAAALQGGSQSESSGLLTPYLVEGRWPDSADNIEGRRVCVIHEELAVRCGLSVGDTLTFYLRDLMAGESGESALYKIADLDQMGNIEESELEGYEIIGVFNAINTFQVSDIEDIVFIPISAYPDSFRYGYTHYYQSVFPNVWFELSSFDAAYPFTAEVQEDMSALGASAVVAETGWANFQAAAKPMRQSSLVNALVFTGIMLAVLSLLTVIYYRMRRKDIAIARALGVSVRQCVPQAALPLLLAGGVGIFVGGWTGWHSTMENAGTVLRSLEEFGNLENAGLSVSWRTVLCGAALVLLAALALCGAWLTAHAPVLTLLQGGAAVQAQKPAKPEPVRQSAPSADRPAVIPTAAAAPASKAGRSLGAAHVLRFVWRHIARSKAKTALTILLAAGFMAGMAAIQLSIIDSKMRMDELYDRTTVGMEIVQNGSVKSVVDEQRTAYAISNFISASTVDAVMDTGLVQEGYLEGRKSASVLLYDGEWVRGQNVSLTGDMTNTDIFYMNDLSRFLSEFDSTCSVTYHNGWDESLFAQDWRETDAGTSDDDPALFPVVLPRELYEEFGIQPGDTIGVYCGSFCLCEVAGYYTGAFEIEDSGQYSYARAIGLDTLKTPLLMPCSAVQAMSGSAMAYSRAQFTLDPSQNRQIDQFQAAVDEIIAGTKSALPLRMVVWDEELRYTVSPLEDSIALMELLYPVVLVLSLLVAAGIAVLFVMTSAKEAAIMRVLGTSKLRSRTMLALQTGCTSAAGLLVGVLGVLVYTGRTRPDLFANLAGASAFCAVLYLLAAIIGSAASASAVTGKNPLELLQVKE